MKTILKLSTVLGLLVALNVQRAPQAYFATATPAKAVPTAAGKTYKVNTKTSVLNWVGTKASGTHAGTIAIKTGELTDNKGQLTGGKVTLDMASLTNTDLTGKSKDGLEGHLKSPDFFDVAQYPTAEFVITGLNSIVATTAVKVGDATHNITGNLTMKGITKSVTFPAVVAVTKKTVSANATFNVDRNEWGITYGEGKVNKEINLKLNLMAVK